MRVGLQNRGFDAETVKMTLLAHRVSTTRQYQSIWSKFLSFVLGQGFSLMCVPKHDLLGLVCNFLRFSSDMGSEYRTIASYRSALRHPLLHACEVDIKCEFSNLLLRGIFHAGLR